jgi:hypothetical protein
MSVDLGLKRRQQSGEGGCSSISGMLGLLMSQMYDCDGCRHVAKRGSCGQEKVTFIEMREVSVGYGRDERRVRGLAWKVRTE